MSFLRRGKRQQDNHKKKLIKIHTKEFYKTLRKLDEVAIKLKQFEVKITEDNIEIEASKVIGRNIDSMEKFFLLTKLANYE